MIQNHIGCDELKNQGGILLLRCCYIVPLHLQTAAYEGLSAIVHVLTQFDLFFFLGLLGKVNFM